jgi:2-succinyl-5-enolpyruvyl-6-hydroxy-3-cyclohexene-1-carboxylate synthase
MGAERQRSVTDGEQLRLFVGAFVDELVRSGLSHVCLCPGSRSTPLALLLRQHPSLTVWTHLDERSAAFFAVGIAKALREPVAVVSTSGTAAVNFAPAVVEAWYAGTPLLVLTADRPPELRHIGALQTIDQVRLYEPHVKWFVEMPLPDASEEVLRYARAIACRAVATARADHAGPVHINFPFREPLIPQGYSESLANHRPPTVQIVHSPSRPTPAELTPLAREFRCVSKGLIVCGPQDDPHFAAVATRVAQELDWPLLADPLSQARCGAHHNEYIIDSYDAFLRAATTTSDLTPEIILRFGATPVSKPLLLYLQQHAASRHILIEKSNQWRDPSLLATDVHRSHPRFWCEALLSALRATSRPSPAPIWRALWTELGRRAKTALQTHLRQSRDFSEPRVFVELANLLPPAATVFAGNSMPVRDLDSFFPGSAQNLRFLANRGASGIDGVVSTALGVSAVSSDPVILTIGDLSFYHDLNGLFAAKHHRLRVTIILLHNDGGGIFSFLPQAQHQEHFEELFGTPHGLDFRPAAEMYGLHYQRPADWEEFGIAVRQALESPGSTLIEIRTDRRANVALHRHLWDVVSRSSDHRTGETP